MKRNIFAIAGFAVCACLAFSSCQDEVDVAEPVQESNEVQQSRPSIGTIVYDTTQRVPVSKSIVIRKNSTVYCYNADLTRKQYTTLKMRNVAGTIIQEWLYENLNTNMFFGYHWSGDPDSTQYGTFYKWQGDLFNLTQSDWDFMMTDANWNAETGFHIPTLTDINNLSSLVGGSANIPNYLNLTYGGYYHPILNENTPLPSPNADDVMWVKTTYHEPGCGVFYAIPKVITDENGSYVCYTNMSEIGCNVRLVRTITMSQW